MKRHILILPPVHSFWGVALPELPHKKARVIAVPKVVA